MLKLCLLLGTSLQRKIWIYQVFKAVSFWKVSGFPEPLILSPVMMSVCCQQCLVLCSSAQQSCGHTSLPRHLCSLCDVFLQVWIQCDYVEELWREGIRSISILCPLLWLVLKCSGFSRDTVLHLLLLFNHLGYFTKGAVVNLGCLSGMKWGSCWVWAFHSLVLYICEGSGGRRRILTWDGSQNII